MGSSFIHGRYADIRVIGMENAQTKSETSILKMLFSWVHFLGWMKGGLLSAGRFFCVDLRKTYPQLFE